MANDLDQEIDAIRSVLSALEPLSPKIRMSVLNYVTNRLEMDLPTSLPQAPVVPPTRSTSEPSAQSAESPSRPYEHIKDLKEAKKPRSNNEMSALVAYYLAHEAPPGKRKDTINQQDIQTYYRIADFPLPEKPQFTLPNAKAAGYLDSAGVGEYKLNPVGHNLVKHSLPRSGASASRIRKKRPAKKKAAKKKAKKRTTKKKPAAKKRTKKK